MTLPAPDPSRSQEERERGIFDGLLRPGERRVRPFEIRRVLEAAGLRPDDVRLEGINEALARLDPDTPLDRETMIDVSRAGLLILEQAATGTMVIPEFEPFRREVVEIFEEVRPNKGGEVADYIPQLGQVDPEQFGLAICTTDGQRLKTGDADVPFCVQSVSKPINYCLALKELGEPVVHRHVGCEPSGVSFNELALDRNAVPHNPMINAGGIMSCAMIHRGHPVSERFAHVNQMWSRLAGGFRPGFDNATYLSERETGDRNYALGYSMREHRAFPPDTDLIETLEFYFQCCSLEMTVDALSVVAATLANGGLCPLTDDEVLQPENVQRCLSLMLSCGMYDYSGEWAFRIGLPAKSGVSGIVMTVVPNVMGICTWSPRLDELGNSVRGIDFCGRLVDRYKIHVYDGLGGSAHDKIDPRFPRNAPKRELFEDLCWAAAEGDEDGINRLVVRGADVNAMDEAGRTPLHMAASEGRDESISRLLEHGADPATVDREGNRPLDEARRHGHEELAERLDAEVPGEDEDTAA